MKATLTTLLTILTFSAFSQIFAVGEKINVADTLGNYFPQIEMLGDAVPAVIWTDQGDKDLYFAKHNGVDDFETPIKLNPAGTDVQSFNWSGANIAVEGNNVYVVYHSDGFETGHIYMVKSTDNGATWSDTVRVDFVADGFAQFPDVAVYNDTVWVVLLDHDASGLNPHYRVTRSTDGGSTWEPDVQASELWPGESCDCCSPEIAVDDERVIITTRNNNSNTREFKSTVSFDRGATFSGMFSVDEHAWFIMSCPSTGADSKFYGTDEFLAIYRTEDGGDPKVYLHHYDLEGDSTITEIDVQADVSNNNGLVNYPQMDYDPVDNRIAIVWESHGEGIDVFLNASDVGPTGLLSSNSINVSDTIGTQSRPDIIVKDGQYHMVYMSTNGHVVKYVQINESAAGFEDDPPIDVQVYPNPAEDKLIIEFGNSYSDFSTIEMRNIQGQIVYRLSSDDSKIKINTEDFAPGAYVYQISNSKGITRGKVLIK